VLLYRERTRALAAIIQGTLTECEVSMILSMSVRVRLGPFSVSSRGRVGARVGPVSAYGGGYRRKRRKGHRSTDGAEGLKVVFQLFALIILAVLWLIVALLLVLTLVFAQPYRLLMLQEEPTAMERGMHSALARVGRWMSASLEIGS